MTPLRLTRRGEVLAAAFLLLLLVLGSGAR